MGVRKNILYMPEDERNAFFEAIINLKRPTIANPNVPGDFFSIYDQFAALHWAVFSVRQSPNGMAYNAGHQGPAFLSWHRELLRRFEVALQNEVPGVMLPYWDWSPQVFTDALMGPDGGGGVGGDVETGWFAFDRPGTPNTPNAGLALPAWWPLDVAGWQIRDDLSESLGTVLRRFMAMPGADTLPVQGDVNALLQITAANPNNAAERAAAAGDFRTALEQAGIAGVTSSHNEVHRFIDGNMNTAPSPNDPIFWLHHCNIDRIWAMWQLDGHSGADWFPISNAQGHQLASPMWPWIANAAYEVLTPVPEHYIPSFAAEPALTNQDVLDHHALGYAYDTEPVLGVALDRSWSMTGASTDPFNMNAPTTKWELAKLGISNLLADCEAAYAAREAYVIGGVQTFTTVAGVNDISPVVANKPFGLVRSGANYPEAYPAADVDAGLGAIGPAGATPLGAALSETYADVVRPAANALPADDVRYLAILTDGKETAAPMLNTIGAGQFSDTYVFGMGFGSGTGWDGVDYATIQTIVAKGKTPPPALNLTQVFQGETMGAIDKFYSSTVAHAIGYTPIMDPRFELFPGEELHLPFWATSAEDGFFITLLRGDPDIRKLHVMLEAPDGKRYDGSKASPYFITIQRRRHRDTIFVRRQRADDPHWIGRWFLHLAYCCHLHEDHGLGHAHDEPHDDPHAGSMAHTTGGMLMHSIADLMLPVGAPPVAGPVFSQFNVPAEKRVSTRLLKAKMPSLGAPVVEPDERGALPLATPIVVNIYAKTPVRVGLTLGVRSAVAGHPLVAAVDLADPRGGAFTGLRATARLVAPANPVGMAFLDRETIPIADRKRYVSRSADLERFDELQFLADYERRKPGVFTPRDEILPMRPEGAQRFAGRIEKATIAGVYRVGAYVEGFLARPGRRPERFTRSLSADVSLGVGLDPRSSRVAVKWDGPTRFEVVLTPQDRFGNLVSPTSMGRPAIDVGGRPAEVAHEDLLDGSHRLTVTLPSDLEQSTADGVIVHPMLHVAGQSMPLEGVALRKRKT